MPGLPDIPDDAYRYWHEVTWWQWFLDMVLRLKVPRARCGLLLAADPDHLDHPKPDAPICPRCAALAGEGDQR